MTRENTMNRSRRLFMNVFCGHCIIGDFQSWCPREYQRKNQNESTGELIRVPRFYALEFIVNVWGNDFNGQKTTLYIHLLSDTNLTCFKCCLMSYKIICLKSLFEPLMNQCDLIYILILRYFIVSFKVLMFLNVS